MLQDSLFHVSIDEFLLPGQPPRRSTRRRQINAMLDVLPENNLVVVESIVTGLCNANKAEG